jgi:hypothetical protein
MVERVGDVARRGAIEVGVNELEHGRMREVEKAEATVGGKRLSSSSALVVESAFVAELAAQESRLRRVL